MADSYPVLTVRQPWASCFIAPVPEPKRVENRVWRMAYRGPMWLHAGARSRWDPAGANSPLVQETWLKATGVPDVPHGTPKDIGLHRNSDRVAFGAVTALLEVTGCHHADECGRSVKVGGRWTWTTCDPWAARGQWHIQTRLVQVLSEPFPCQGQRNLWRLPLADEAQVRKQLEAS